MAVRVHLSLSSGLIAKRNQRVRYEMMKILPIPVLEILPVAVMPAAPSNRRITTTQEASTTRDPVVAPAGTVLRVRLHESLETGRSRPGDRSSGISASALLAGSLETLPNGTIMESADVRPGAGCSGGSVISFGLNGHVIDLAAGVVV